MIPWGASTALLPFWRLDDKGGEVVLLGLRGFAWVGHKHLHFSIRRFLAYAHLAVNFKFVICGLFETLCQWLSGFISWSMRMDSSIHILLC